MVSGVLPRSTSARKAALMIIFERDRIAMPVSMPPGQPPTDSERTSATLPSPSAATQLTAAPPSLQTIPVKWDS